MKSKSLLIALILLGLCSHAQVWRHLDNVPTNALLYRIKFADNNWGIITGDQGTILRTTDGGNTWSTANSCTTIGLFHSYIVNHDVMFAGGESILLKSTDGGLNWSQVNIPIEPTFEPLVGPFFFINDNVGYMSVFPNFCKTTDGGNTWVEISGPYISFMEMYFLNENTGFALAGDNSVYKTLNGGITWSSTELTLTGNLDAICFTDSLTGYIAGANGRLFKTVNGGNTWNLNIVEPEYELFSLYFVNSNLGYSCGFNPNHDDKIYKTTDGGTSWSVSYNSLTDNLTDIVFTNSQTGYAICDFGVILKGMYPNTVKGKVFNDINNNNVYDAGDFLSDGIVMGSSSGNNGFEDYFTTIAGGNYYLSCDSGNYTVSVSNELPYSLITPANHSGYFNGLQNTDSNRNFAIHYFPNVKDIKITLSSLTAAARPGFDVSYKLTYKNIGSVTMNGSLQLEYDNSEIYLNSSPAYSTMNSNIMTWNYSNLLPQQSEDIIVTFQVPSSTSLGDTIFNFAAVYPIIGDTAPLDNKDSLKQIVVGSYDPNQKEVQPGDAIDKSEVISGQYLTYTIHFQNTGTDTAFNIRILDCLNDNLVKGSFEILSYSHYCTWVLQPEGTLEFNFPNIKLPDSSINNLGSNGFIKFRIKLKNTLSTDDTIYNNANIFFDFNSSISTNTVKNYIIDTALSIDENIQSNLNDIFIFPNPATEKISIINGYNEIIHLDIMTIRGHLIQSFNVADSKTDIDISSYDKGIYLLKIYSASQSRCMKFVKM